MIMSMRRWARYVLAGILALAIGAALGRATRASEGLDQRPALCAGSVGVPTAPCRDGRIAAGPEAPAIAPDRAATA